MKSEEAAFVAWAAQSLAPIRTVAADSDWEDLEPLGRMIAGANIVALCEAVHFGAEPLEFRNRVLQYLVKEHGFTAIAIESGIVEGHTIHEYVKGGPGELETVVAQGIGWTFDRLPQNRELVGWLRAYNSEPRRDRKISFYGFDVPGSPTIPLANRGVETALIETLRFLDIVDPGAAEIFRSRTDRFLRHLNFDVHRQPEAPGYDRLSQAERDALTSTLADIVTLIQRREAQYSASTSPAQYEWAHRTALGACQTDAFLRQIPMDWQPLAPGLDCSAAGRADFLSAANDVRDRAQLDNIEWILRQEGSAGKLLIHASCYHLSTQPVCLAPWAPAQQEVLGTYLRRRHGDRFVSIGNLMGECGPGCADVESGSRRAPASSIDAIAAAVGTPRFLLDLRTAPPPVARWLQKEHALWQGQGVLKLHFGKAFDLAFYLDAVSAACRPGQR